MIKFRGASKKDTGAILELLAELGRPTPINKSQKTHFEKMINSYISDKDKILLVACDDNKVIGIASVVLMDRLNQITKEMYIPELVVSAKYRGMGIGKKLISQCVRIAINSDCFRIRLESGYSRTSSHKFYRKTGFEDYAITFKKILS